MKEVYIVIQDYDDCSYTISGVFGAREDAIAFRDQENDAAGYPDFSVVEWTVHQGSPKTFVKPWLTDLDEKQ